MVSGLSIITMVFVALFCVAVPTLAFVYVNKREKYARRGLLAGILSFFILQMIIRIPVLQVLLPQFEWYKTLVENPLGIALFLGFTAGLFETVGRWVFMKFMLKGKESYGTGLAHGIGHGGIEAVLLVSLAYVNLIIYSFMINSGTFDALIVGEAAEQISAVKESLINTSPALYLVAALERLFAMVFHVAMSVLLMEGFAKKRVLPYFLIVLGLHSLIDFLAVYLGQMGVPIWGIELMVGLFAVGGAVYIYKAKSRFQKIDKVAITE